MSRPKRGRSQSSPPVSDDEGSVGLRKRTTVEDDEEEDNKEGILGEIWEEGVCRGEIKGA